jgi:hypothetical protein
VVSIHFPFVVQYTLAFKIDYGSFCCNPGTLTYQNNNKIIWHNKSEEEEEAWNKVKSNKEVKVKSRNKNGTNLAVVSY